MSSAKPSPGGGTAATVPLEQLCGFLATLAPLRLAESWDNVGLLVGDRSRAVGRVMTCLTITPAVTAEAVAERAGLVIAHHPLPFKPLARLTADTVPGRLLLSLAEGRVAVYSAHTAFDSATEGINQQWADAFGIPETLPLIEPELKAGVEAEVGRGAGPSATVPVGAGRYGKLREPMPLEAFVRRGAAGVGSRHPRLVGDPERLVKKVAFACGSGGSFLGAAVRRGCDVLLTGEATFHTCLEAESLGIGLGLLGHYWSERFAMEWLAERVAEEFPGLAVWASRSESDPLVTLRVDPVAGAGED